MVLLLIGLMAFIGAVMLLVSGISTLVSFGFSIILKMVLGLAGIFYSVCDISGRGDDELMIWLQILGWILMLLPLAGILILAFIADWRGTLFTLAMVGMMFLGAFLLRGKL